MAKNQTPDSKISPALQKIRDRVQKKKDLETDKVTASKAAGGVKGIVKYEKAMKWKYPEDVTTAQQRKLWRAKMRNELRKLIRELNQLEGVALEKKQKAIAKLKKEVLINPESFPG